MNVPLKTPLFDGSGDCDGPKQVSKLGNLTRTWILYFQSIENTIETLLSGGGGGGGGSTDDGSVTFNGLPVSYTAPYTITITAGSPLNPTHLTSVAHGMATGAPITISGATLTWAGLNGNWVATVLDADHFTVAFNALVPPLGALTGTVTADV